MIFLFLFIFIKDQINLKIALKLNLINAEKNKIIVKYPKITFFLVYIF